MLKIGKLLFFGTNETYLTDKLTSGTSKYQNDILTDDENYHDTQHIFLKKLFWYLAVLITNSLKSQSLKRFNLF